MRRLKIQRVSRVPPIPTTIIVIPNVQLSIFKHLLIVQKNKHPPYIILRKEFQQKSDFFNKVSQKAFPFYFKRLYSFVLSISKLFGLVHEGFKAG